jgi:8-oxo-dGTP pyrophosphatase MutT (NUDIX family)
MYYVDTMYNRDIQFVVDDTTFNYRIVVLLETPSGYVFEKSNDGYLFAVGGKASVNEDSSETARRELMEELRFECGDLKLVSVIENFFVIRDGDRRFHEVSLVYKTHSSVDLELDNFKSSNSQNCGFVAVRPYDFDTVTIKPVVLAKIILDDQDFVHIINKNI